jgi:hypothetical protein
MPSIAVLEQRHGRRSTLAQKFIIRGCDCKIKRTHQTAAPRKKCASFPTLDLDVLEDRLVFFLAACVETLKN